VATVAWRGAARDHRQVRSDASWSDCRRIYDAGMATDIVCTSCGVDDHLTGHRRDDDLIELHCEACDVTFTRDPRPSCPKCGGFEMEAMPKVLLEKSRGAQLSIQGVQREFLCRECDRASIRAQRDGHLPGRLGGSD